MERNTSNVDDHPIISARIGFIWSNGFWDKDGNMKSLWASSDSKRDDDISHNLVGKWTKNKLSGGVKQGTFHIHTCRIDWKTPKRYNNRVSDLILMYMYWLSIHAIKSISYWIKHDNKYLVSESRSSMMLCLTTELFFIEIVWSYLIFYIHYKNNH